MLRVRDGIILQPGDDLPPTTDGRVFLDAETTSFDRNVRALDPWKGHRVAGVGYALDDDGPAWYLPIRHRDSNLDLETVRRWLSDVMRRTSSWCNHNVKFDAHFLAADGVEPPTAVEDTLTLAKVVDSSRMSYTLDQLGRDLLGEGKTDDQLDAWIKGARTKNWGDAPVDLLGAHCCRDVMMNRALLRRLARDLPSDCERIWQLERKVTLVLYDVERTGLRVDVRELKVTALRIMAELLGLEEDLAELAGFAMNPGSNDDCYAALCTSNGLPVMGRTDAGDPSFDVEALQHYARLPQVSEDPRLSRLVESIAAHREKATLLHLFVEPYLDLQVDGVLHPSYNQAVRTGRMSCSRPNAQQLSSEAKRLVHPAPGCAFLGCDYSQIEFRILVHYMNNPEAVEAYARDPSTDYHAWVAQLCGIPRRPAKNVNFAMGYGAGRPKVVRMLAQEPELVHDLMLRIDEAIASGRLAPESRKTAFDAACQRRGQEVYRLYHARLPELRRVSRQATRNAEHRGYVFNAYGRRRHLSRRDAWRALNTVSQGLAADIMKDRLVATAPRYCRETRGLQQCAVVHDEVLFHGPSDELRAAQPWIVQTLEHPECSLRVPIRAEAKWSARSWGELEPG